MATSLNKRFFVGIAIGGLFTSWFLYKVHWVAMWESLRTVHVGWILAAAGLLLLEQLFRSLRWSLLIRHLDPDVKLFDLLSAILVGAAMNTILPLRGGDLVRPAVLAKRRGLTYSAVLSTTVVERICDVVGLLALLGLTMSLFDESVVSNQPNTETVGRLRGLGGLVFIGCVGVIAGTFVLRTSFMRRAVARISEWLPKRLGAPSMTVFDRVVQGLQAVGKPWRIFPALLLTLCMWGNGFCAIMCLFAGFGLDLGPLAAMFTQSALGLVVALPQAPGYWGPFQVAVSETMMVFGSEEGISQASAILFWAVCFVPVTTLGLLEASRIGWGSAWKSS